MMKHHSLNTVNLKADFNWSTDVRGSKDSHYSNLSKSLLASYQEKSRLLADYLPPSDRRVQTFINEYFSDLEPKETPQLPNNTLVLDRHELRAPYHYQLTKTSFAHL